MQEIIKEQIKKVLKDIGIKDEIDFVVEHPENFENGDYTANVVMVYAKKIGTNPKDLAEKIVAEINKNKIKEIEKVIVAGPGFINFYLTQEFFIKSISEILKQKENWGKNDFLLGDKIMVEYTQPNPFKPFHIGHLMSNAIGESISRIVEFSGAKIIRANYQGDVGPHVAKAIYGLLKFGMPDGDKSVSEKAQYIGECYSKGSNLYDTDENAKLEINEINRKVYDRSDKKINEIYDWGRKVTLEAFEIIYKTLGTKFDKYYFESQMAGIGKRIVMMHVGDVFEKSDEAIVFHGEEHDAKLHTRVFINSQGLPTYEAKELGLNFIKFRKSLFKKQIDLSIVTTAVEQAEYMKVVASAISLIHPEMEDKMVHITHGMMRLASGKMSSRKGNVITGESLLQDSMDVVLEKVENREFNEEEKKEISRIVGVAALKYSILKPSLGSDIIYDFEKSISFDGDSGPYLQYTVVRANSILEKAIKEKIISAEYGYFSPEKFLVLTPSRSQASAEIIFFSQDILERLLYRFPEVVERSYKEFAPHYVANYLTELASAFNSFYGNTKILDKENKFMEYQLSLVKAFSQTMQNGLWLLGIEVPKRM